MQLNWVYLRLNKPVSFQLEPSFCSIMFPLSSQQSWRVQRTLWRTLEPLSPTSDYRFTILTDRLIRYEWASDGQFEDRASTFAVNRNFSVPWFRLLNGDDLQIITEHFHLNYNKQQFTPGGLLVHLNSNHTGWGRFVAVRNLWRPQSGRHSPNFDLCNGRCDMGQGIMLFLRSSISLSSTSPTLLVSFYPGPSYCLTPSYLSKASVESGFYLSNNKDSFNTHRAF